MGAPSVSVLMASFNCERFIGTAIESVLASTFSDFEFIIVDDCSTDKTFSIINDFAGRDSRIRVFRNEKRLGDYPNRNKAASFANGKYLKYVDHDDYIYPWGIALMVESMEKFPDAGWGICSLNADKDRPFPFRLDPPEIFEYQNFKASLFHNPPLCAIIKKQVFDAIGGFSGKPLMSDVEMWHLLSLKYSMVLMQHGLVWYRVHEGQESKRVQRDIALRTRYAVAKFHFYKSSRELPLGNKKRRVIIKRMHQTFLKYILINICKGKIKSAYIILKMIPNHQFDFKEV